MIKLLQKSFFSSIKDKIRKERLSRLALESVYYPLNSSIQAKIRNLGIIAHIDAGKTTTTERMLFYAGALLEPGEVHDGNTVMDYMQQERDRGITIRAAAISFNWEGHQLNLIDTPGHIDFTGEVERSLKVIDGAVAIFDGVSGVQTQSEMVWLQANKGNIPRIAFINKMDRPGASLESTLESIKKKLNVTPLVIQIPVGEGELFSGIIDLLKMEKILWKDNLGTTVEKFILEKNDKFYEKAFKERENLLENLSILDDQIAELYLEAKEISIENIESAIKRQINANPQKTCVVLLGSSLKNKGIQPLLDSIVKYLPSPEEILPLVSVLDKNIKRLPKKEEKLCVYAYKVVNEKEKGSLVYVRVFSGKLSTRTPLFNASKGQTEKIQYIYRVRGNKYVMVSEIAAGDIVALSGLKYTHSGDTLIELNDEKFVLEQINMPKPVFMCSLEYESQNDKPKLDIALQEISREDSSLIIKDDEETGQILISGLGELHLEVVKDRLLLDYGLKVSLGRFRVAYRESILGKERQKLKFSKIVNGKPLYMELELEIERKDEENSTEANEIELSFNRTNELDEIYTEFKKRKTQTVKRRKQKDDENDKEDLSSSSSVKSLRNPTKPEPVDTLEDDFGEESLYALEAMPLDQLQRIEQTIENSFTRGNLLGYPLVYIRARILNGKFSMRRSTNSAIEMCTAQLMKNLLTSSESVLLEPMMDIEISTPRDLVNTVLNDILANRRGKIIEMTSETNKFQKTDDDRQIISAIIPMETTIGYSTFLRSISKGEASFIMKLKNYDTMSSLRQKEVISNPP